MLGVGGALGHFAGGMAGFWEFYQVSRHSGTKADVPAVAPITMSLTVGGFEAPADDAGAVRLAQGLGRELATSLGAVEPYVRLIAVDPAASDKRSAARRAGARYVVEGEVARGSGNADLSVVAMRLIDVGRGAQAWAGRFELPGAQAALVGTTVQGRKLVDELASALETAEVARALTVPAAQADAMEWVLRAWAQWNQSVSLPSMLEVQRRLDAALQRDPNLFAAVIGKCGALDNQYDVDPGLDRDRYAREMDQLTTRAVALGPRDPRAWKARAEALLLLGRFAPALEAADEVIRLDPYLARNYGDKAWFLSLTGRPQEALAMTAKALALDPADPGVALRYACEAHMLLGQNDAAIETCERASALLRASSREPHMFLPAVYANAGDLPRARAALQALLQSSPNFTLAQLRAKRYSEHPEYQKLAEKYWYEGLRKAGLPER